MLLRFILLACLVLLGCSEPEEQIRSMGQLNDSRYTVGYYVGQSSEAVLPQVLPNARLKPFSDAVTGYEALRKGQIDGFAFERMQMELAIMSGFTGVHLLPETLGDTVEMAVGVSRVTKIPDLKRKIDEFIRLIREDGTLGDMQERWLVRGADSMPEIPAPENADLVLNVGTSGVVPPYSYYKGEALTGFDIEFARRLALWLNAKVKFKVYDYNSIVAAAVSGDIDCILANLNITAERAERIDFSNPISRLDNAIMVRGDVEKTEDLSSVAVDLKDVPPQFRGKKLKYTSIDEMNKNKRLVLGMQTGFVFVDKETRRMLPGAKIEYYKSTPDMAYLVANGKLDGFINDEPVIRYAALNVPNLAYIHCGFEPLNVVVAFPKTAKGKSLRDEMNEFIERHRAAGTLDSLDSLWLGHDEAKKVVNFPKAKPGRPTLKMGTLAESAPFEYVKDGKIVGYEMNLMALFCEEYGYGVEVHNVPFESLLLGLESSTYDFVASTLSEMPSITEHFYHTGAIYVSECVMAVQVLENEQKPAFTPRAAEIFEELNRSGQKIGMGTGVSFEKVVMEHFPKADIQYFNTYIDLANHVKAGKLDAMVLDEPSARMLLSNVTGLSVVDEYLDETDFAFAFPKTEKGTGLNAQMTEFIQKGVKAGLKTDLERIWFGSDESLKKVDLSRLSAKNGVLRLGTNSENPPFTYIKDNAVVGYDIDWIVRFCEAYGYGLQIMDMKFESLMSALVSGQVDLAAGGMAITEERKEMSLFSEPIYDGGVVVVVKTPEGHAEQAADEEADFWESLKSSFEKTFVRESRWKLVVDGIEVTIFISILSAVFGTFLGFLICLMRLSRNKVADAIAIAYIRILQGTPSVVLLMILFYVVFARTGLDGVWVAIIGFGMNFGAYVSEMMRTGIEAVDRGQMEAALALGYTKPRAFFKIVLPQAARHFLPVFQGEFISLVKMTSVVGYIAIQDLTKASDIIRSRTYEAFFPLVTTAIIYFAIAWFLTRVLTAIQKRLDPKRRRNRLKF